LPATHDLSAVPSPATAASFKAACDAIAAVRKAKTGAGLSLAAPVGRISLTCYEHGASVVAAVLGDLASASGTSAEHITVTEKHEHSDTPVVAEITISDA
jgi:hypothetical protein